MLTEKLQRRRRAGWLCVRVFHSAGPVRKKDPSPYLLDGYSILVLSTASLPQKYSQCPSLEGEELEWRRYVGSLKGKSGFLKTIDSCSEFTHTAFFNHHVLVFAVG